MKNENFRKVTDRNEIYGLLQEAVSTRAEVILWQVNEGIRKVMLANLVSLDEEEQSIVFQSHDNKDLNFSDDKKINIQSEFRGLIFYSEVIKLDKLKLIAGFPENIKVMEQRTGKMRKTVHTEELDIKAEIGKTDDVSRYKLLEISEKGCSIIVKGREISQFEEGERFNLSKVDKMNLTRKIKAKVSYVAPLMEDKNDFRVGFSFSTKIPHYILNELKNY